MTTTTIRRLDLRYDRATIALHWATALLVAALWIIGQTADMFPRGAFRSAYWTSHLVFGFVLLAIFAVRLVWRFTEGRKLPDPATGILNIAAKAGHHALYALLFIVLGLGVINAFVRGYHLYGLFALPQIGDPAWKRPVNELHEWAANILLALAGGHALAALWHQYVLRDGLLRRMKP